MDRIYILTGANGHLGRVICQKLLEGGARVHGLLLPGEAMPFATGENFTAVHGDVRDMATLRPLFYGTGGKEIILIHAAAVIDIRGKVQAHTYDVNVNGTKNMVELALLHHVHRFIHVSSVHAIPELPQHRTIREVQQFSPAQVEGGYAKTKAEATQYVLDAVRKNGLPAVVLHPSGILGPQDSGTNNVVSAIRSFLEGSLKACPKTGGYDFVDVRDVAAAVLAAVDKGRIGETYILSGRYYNMRDIFGMLRQITGLRAKCHVIPMWLTKIVAPMMERRADRKKKPPLITRYSMYTLTSNGNFSHEKASRELGYWPRDIYDTLKDTIAWLKLPKSEKPARRKRRRRKAAAGA